MPMTDDQAIRLQCLELAVKAGAPWNRLTDTADMLTAYVRGINARVATDQIDSLTPAGLAEYRRTGRLSTETAISPADKGVAVEDSSNWPDDMPAEEIKRREDLLKPPDIDWLLKAQQQAGVPLEDPAQPPPGVIDDPRLPTVTM